MATLKQVQDELDNLTTHIATEAAEVKATIAQLTTEIETLKGQLNTGVGVTAADLDGIVGRLKEMEAGIDGIVTPAPAA